MFNYNGIGTKLYGSTDTGSDGSYVTTKWFVFIYLPIIPLESFRVVKEDSSNIIVYKSQKYRAMSIPLHKKQVVKTYFLVYGIIGILILLSKIF